MVKQEPSAYSWDDFVRDGGTAWTGVRNHQAKLYLAAMKAGDRVLFYHSVVGKEVVGEAEVVREARPETGNGPWVAVDLRPVARFAQPVTLETMRGHAALAGMALLRQSRLSVLPLTAAEYRVITGLGRKGCATARAATRRT